jgi:hypothetical protein
VTLLGLFGAACEEPCNRNGCDALQKHLATDGGPRIAGIVASESDVVGNGCQECGFVAAEIKAWPVEQEVTTDAELRAATASTPQSTMATENGRYTLPVPPGLYVVCFQSSCFNASAATGETTTLNVRLINGISQGFISVFGSEQLMAKDALILPPS